jgi:uncharacterized protein DUF3606
LSSASYREGQAGTPRFFSRHSTPTDGNLQDLGGVAALLDDWRAGPCCGKSCISFPAGTGRRRHPFSNKEMETGRSPCRHQDEARPTDAKFISFDGDDEIEYWTEKFGVTRAHLARAVGRVGRSAEAVGRYLKRPDRR